MRRLKFCFMIIMCVMGFLIFSNNVSKAATTNFSSESSKIVIENSENYPFEDATKDGFNVIRSTNFHVDSADSELKIIMTGTVEISFKYLVLSEGHFDFLEISVDGKRKVQASDVNNNWESFSWLNDKEEGSTVILIKYVKDRGGHKSDDRLYLRDLVVDDRDYAPSSSFTIDGEQYPAKDNTIYFSYGSNEGIIKFVEEITSTIHVFLNSEIMSGNNNEFNLKHRLGTYNVIDVKFVEEGYRDKDIKIIYNEDLKDFTNADISFTNDSNYLYVISQYKGEGVIASTNIDNNTTSTLEMKVSGSGEFSFDYLVSGRKDYEFISVKIDGNEVFKDSGINSEFKTLNYTFYENKEHIILVSYIIDNNDYSVGDKRIYLKNINYEYKEYASAGVSTLNGNAVIDGKYYAMDSEEEYVVTISDLVNSSVTVKLNNVVVNGDANEYTLTNLLGVNLVEIIYSEDSKYDQVIKFYLYSKEVSEIFSFDNIEFSNDAINPFIVSIKDEEMVMMSNIQKKENTASEIRFKASNAGLFVMEYLVSCEEKDDYLYIRVNDTTVLKESGRIDWSHFSYYLVAGDIIKIGYYKDGGGYYYDDTIYLRNINYTVKNYTTVGSGKINELDFDSTSEFLEFDYENRDSILTLNDINPNQSVEVRVNGNVVNESSNQYVLTAYLGYSNVIEIIYNEEGKDSNKISFKYNARLYKEGVNTLDYVSNPAFVLDGNESVITLDSERDSFIDEVLTFKVSGNGIFTFDFGYFTYNNLDVLVCIDREECVNVIDTSGSYVADTIIYTFDYEGSHKVSIVVNSEYYFSDTDYFYINNVTFYKNSDTVSLIEGEGSETSPYDYSPLIERLLDYGVNSFYHNFYNSEVKENIYILNIANYTFTINGTKVSNSETLNSALNIKGKNTITITNNSNIYIVLYYYNEGLNDSSIEKGYGSESSPYEIYNEEQLRDISKGLNYNYKIMDDITLSSEWMPLGEEENPFTGSLDGDNHMIKGLIINGVFSHGSDALPVALFAYATEATISNLTIENAQITMSGDVTGGTLIAFSSGGKITNVTVIANISCITGTTHCIVGGLVGYADYTEFYNVDVSGSIIARSDDSINIAGGITGFGGQIYDSISTVSLEIGGIAGGIMGVCDSEYCLISNTIMAGDLKKNVITEGYEFNMHGLFVANPEMYIFDSKHRLSVAYTGSLLDVKEVYIYGMGLDMDGVSVPIVSNTKSGNFEVDILLNGEDELTLLSAGAVNTSGYVIRFVMSDGKYKYYSINDTNNNRIVSNISVDLDSLKSYSNNFSSMSVNNLGANYTEKMIDGKIISVSLNVIVDNEDDFEHLAYVINYGIAVNFGSYYVSSYYSATINLILNSDLDLTNSSFAGLGNGIYSPYFGNIDGNNHLIKLNMNHPNTTSKGLINYYSVMNNQTSIIKNLTVSGNITGGYSASIVGFYRGSELQFINVTNKAIMNAYISGGLLGYVSSGRIVIEDCTNYASFSGGAFANASYIYGSITFKGINRNYGELINGVEKNITMIFINRDSSINMESGAVLENYYIMDVKEKDVRLTINGSEFVSDDNGLITFKMNNDNLYKVTISSTYLKEKEYSLNANFRGELLVPNLITLKSSNELHDDSVSDWLIEADVTYFGGSSSSTITFTPDLSESDLSSDELVFNDVSLVNDTYVISDKVMLTRYTSLLEESKDAYDSLVAATSDFKNKGEIAKEKFDALSSKYVEDSVSEETLSFYNNYISDNEIDEEKLNEWLSVIISSVTLKDSLISVVYGDTLETFVVITYLDGSSEEVSKTFDYTLEDITDYTVNVTSTSKVTSNKGDLVVYDEYCSFVIGLEKRKLEGTTETFTLEYNGVEKTFDVFVSNISEKFNDTISNVEIIYKKDGVTSITKDAGIYSAEVSFEITNSLYYESCELKVENLIISPKAIDVTWIIDNNLVYDGSEKLIGATYRDVSNKKIELELEIKKNDDYSILFNAGTYIVKIVNMDPNYTLPEGYEDLSVTISKKDVTSSISLEKNTYVYTGETIIPEIEVEEYNHSIKYYLNDVEVSEVIKPNNYKVRVIVDEENECADKYFDFTVNKKEQSSRDVEIDIYYNRIVIKDSSNLEYKVNEGDYIDASEISVLEEVTKYTISVRVKENEIEYASEPITYVITTTRDPKTVTDLIDSLTSKMNEENLTILKKITKYLKDTNLEEVDSSKLEKYESIKVIFEEVMNSYEEDSLNANKIGEFMQNKFIIIQALVSALVALYFVRRKFYL